MAETLERSGAAARARFLRHLGDPALDGDAVAWMRGVAEESGALAACERRIDDYVGKATAALESGLLDDAARSPLADLVVAATDRKY